MVKKISIFIFAAIIFSSCNSEPVADEAGFKKVLVEHIDAVKNADIEALKATVPTEGSLLWVKPNGEYVNTVQDFIGPHTDWFSNSAVHMDYKIIHSEAGTDYGFASVTMDFYYTEDKNGGKDVMQVIYILKKINGEWKVVFDQATKLVVEE